MAMVQQLVENLHPGPIDESLLFLQTKHCSEAVWHDLPERVLQIRRTTTIGHATPTDPRLLGYLEQAGFLGVAKLAFIQVDWHLISALVERWRPETHTFHFPTEDATITLQDVEILLGLPVDGRPVTGYSAGKWSSLCKELLGVVPPKDKLNGQQLSIEWLHDHLPSLEAEANDLTIQRHAHAYILGLMAGIVFPNKTNRSVHLMFLPLLRDLVAAGQFSWGSACLSWLYQELSCNRLLL